MCAVHSNKNLAGWALPLAGALMMAGGTAHAESVPKVPAPEPTPTATAPAPAAAPAPASAKPFILPYGVFKPTVIVSNGVESFGQLNQTSINAAVNPALDANPEEVAYTFQVAQSRFGVYVGGDSPIKAQLEIDFLHTDQASPTTGAFPRLRLAQVEWTASSSLKLALGQGNDVFAPLSPFVFNLTSALFTAGNSGVQRQQAYALYTHGVFEAVLGAGLPGNNNTAVLGNLEEHSLPSGVLRLAVKTPSKIYVGAGAIATSLAYTKVDEPIRKRTTVVGNVFAEAEIAGVGLRAEGYGGQNAANIGLNTLGAGRYDTDMTEIGGFVSTKWPVSGPFATQLAVGGAKVLHGEDVVPAYTMDTTTNTRSARTGLGIEWNMQARLGLSYTVASMTAFVEPFVLATRHVLAEQDAAIEARRTATGVESGFMYKF